MYESRKNMGDVCEDVSSSIEKRKDVLSDAVGLDLEDYVVLHDLGKVIEASITACYKNYRQKFEEALKGVTK